MQSSVRRALAVTLISLISPSAEALPGPDEVTFTAADGIRLYGDLHLAANDQQAPLILLFHQAGGDARGEYGPLIPRLIDRGFSVLALDQRAGGTRFGSVNRTVAGLEGKEYSYCEAYPDLVAALDYVQKSGFSGPRFAWGSSYSASLVIRLGAQYGDVLAGVLAFSPASGGPMAACSPDQIVQDLDIPVLALRPASEMKLESVQKQLLAFEKHGAETHVAANGVHGSSMLVENRVDGDVGTTWEVVLEFLDRVVAGRSTKSRDPRTPDFMSETDLISLHYDHAPDRDDGQSAAADRTLLESLYGRGWLTTHTVAVSGTYGLNRDQFNPASDRVMDVVFNDVGGWISADYDDLGCV